jgi:hypothetical protein
MSTGAAYLAVAFAVAHGLFIVALIVGGPLSARWPRLARAHLVAVAGTAAVFLSGSDCPFTVAELFFRRHAGWSTFDTGFVSHHLVEPLHPAGITPWVQVLLVAAWVVPTVVGHTLRLRRARGAAAVAAGREADHAEAPA